MSSKALARLALARTGTAVPRWAVSFADLVLLLLGCFVFLHAIEAARPVGARSATAAPSATRAGAALFAATDLFEAGEARLTDRGRARVQALAGGLRHGRVAITSRGLGEGGTRLDRFELAAARSVAVARALREAGIDEHAIAVSFEESSAGAGQRIEVAAR
jgi:flagellar motor protein MotB